MNAIMNVLERRRRHLSGLGIMLVVSALIAWPGRVQAQLTNGDFEAACTGTGTVWEAFQTLSSPSTDCVDGPWRVSHGTPDIYRNTTFDPSAIVRLWCPDTVSGEGLFIDCPNFLAGHTYRVRYRLQTQDANMRLYISLASGLVHRDIRNWAMQTTGVTEVNIHSGQPPSLNAWWTNTAGVTFTPAANFPHLMFYGRPAPNTTVTNSDLFFDDVVITEVLPPCAANVHYTAYAGTTGGFDWVERSDFIRASGTSAVSGMSQVTFQAGNYVRLEPNFHAGPASSGGYFHAFIAPCATEVAIQSCTNEGLGKEGGELTFDRGIDLSGPELDNYPNPFAGRTTISYKVEEQGPVSLTVTNMLGVQIAELVNNSNHGIGQFTLEFNSTDLPPGMYYLRLTKGTTQMVKKMMVSP